MRSLNHIASILLSLLLISSHASPTPHQAPLGPSPSPSPAAAIPFTFRNATLEDADDITTVWYDAFRSSNLWHYLFQFADDVDPLYRWTCQRDAHLQALQDESSGVKFTVITVQVPDPTTSSSPEGAAETRERVVSFAMWDFNQTRPHRDQGSPTSPQMLLPMGLHGGGGGGGGDTSGLSPFNCSARLDINMTRSLHYSGRMSAAKDKYLDKPLGPQLYLGLLATHPGWDGNGFAAVQLGWGKAQLGRLGAEVGGGGGGGGGLPLTLLASPAGYPLYVSEGFEGLKNATVERLDGEGGVME